MAFGISRQELEHWRQKVTDGNIAFLTHYWTDPRFPGCNTVTKVGCSDISKLAAWGRKYGLQKEWIDRRREDTPHFDLFGDRQREILQAENQTEQLERFQLEKRKRPDSPDKRWRARR